MTALLGTFVSIKTMADGSPRLTLDMQCTLADIAAMGLQPGVPFAIARITNESSVAPIPSNSTEIEKPKGGALAKLAGMWCNDPEFWKFCSERFQHQGQFEGAEEVADLVRDTCCINSRAELDTNEKAAGMFNHQFRLPYMAWKEGRNT